MKDQNLTFKNDLHVPRVKPFSNDTWEASVPLFGTLLESEVEQILFPAACRIVGLYPSVTLNDASGLVVPTTDDILLQFSVNQQRVFTANVGQTSQGRNGSGFATLAALNTVLRDLNIEVSSPRPQFAMKARWKRFTSPAAPIYRDVLVTLSLFVEIADQY